MFRKMRRYNYPRPIRRIRAEVKFKPTSAALIVRHFNFGSGGTDITYSGSKAVNLITFPSQGTTDNTRIGDTIQPVKLYVKFGFSNYEVGEISDGVAIRVVIFSAPFEWTVASTIVNFFQTSIPFPVYQGMINHEVISKVYYDKVHVIYSNGTYQPTKLYKVNIKLYKPIVFSAGGTTPRDPKNILYMVVMGQAGKEDRADATVIGSCFVHSNFYYTDA